MVWSSEGFKTLEGYSIFDIRVFNSSFCTTFIVVLEHLEGIDNEVPLQNEKML